MKALSLTEPWATLVVTGEKKIETRSWKTPYRGLLAIQAAKGFPTWAKETVLLSFFKQSLSKHGIHSHKDFTALGAIIGTIEVVACISTDFGDVIRLDGATYKNLLPAPLKICLAIFRAIGLCGFWKTRSDSKHRLFAGEH